MFYFLKSSIPSVGTAYSSRAPKFIPVFHRLRVAQFLILCLVCCRLFLDFFAFFHLAIYCLIFDFRLLITSFKLSLICTLHMKIIYLWTIFCSEWWWKNKMKNWHSTSKKRRKFKYAFYSYQLRGYHFKWKFILNTAII